MESDDDFGNLVTSHVSELRTQMGRKNVSDKEDKSSSEDEEASVESKSDDEGMIPPVAEHALSDTSIKLEPESQSDDNLDDGAKDALISSTVRELKLTMGYSDSSEELNESSDEDDLSVKSEADDGLSVKSEPETNDEAHETGNESDEDKEHTMESMDTGTSTKKGDESALKVKETEENNIAREEQIQRKMKKSEKSGTQLPEDIKIDQPRSKKEKELMSLVFGGKAAFVSQLDQQEKKAVKPTQPYEDARKTDKSKSKRSAIWHEELNESSDEDDLSVMSEADDGLSVKSEPETNDEAHETGDESDEDKEHTMESMDTGTSTKKGDESALKVKETEENNIAREEQIQRKMKKSEKSGTQLPEDIKIDQPRSKKEKELMSLVFGGKAAFVSQLDQQEKKAVKPTQPYEDARKTDKSKSKRSAIWHEELNESSDEDDLSVMSEADDGLSVKSEPETNDEAHETGDESDEDKEHTMESMDTGTSTKKGDESALKVKETEENNIAREEQIQRKMKKSEKSGTQLPEDIKIDQPRSKKEKELMSLVFGGKAAFVSELDQQEKKGVKPTQPYEDARKTDKSKSKRSAIWHDSDDDDEDSANIKRNKFSRQEMPEQLTKERRRKQFEQIVGKPKWADLDRVQEPDSDDEILQKVGHVVKGTPSQGLPKGTIELKKLKNLNRETNAEGSISSICFHPTSMVAIITGKRGLVSIVAVDGVRNEKLHTIWLPKMRVVCSTLSPDGNEAIFGSFRKFYHVYNLISGQSDTLKIPHQETWMMKNFRVSRCGKYLASAGDCGEVHLMCAKSKDVLQTIQLRYTCYSLAFTPDSRYLLCHSNDMEVYVFSLEQKRIVNIFQDDGCVNGSCIAICPNGQYVATGSRQGVVNIYALEVTLTQKNPAPLKTITNLTTYIDSLSFNATSELLVIASSTIKNAVKLFHVKSGTVFRNFPLHMTNLGKVTVAEFSPSGGYLALGTKGSKVLLFRVKHYPNY